MAHVFQLDVFQTGVFQQGDGGTHVFQCDVFQHNVFQNDCEAEETPVEEAPASPGGVGGQAWRGWYRDLSKRHKKRHLLDELDDLIEIINSQPVPDSLYGKTAVALEIASSLSLNDTNARIEAQILALRELLEEIDDEEVALLLL